jgi:hypothetical protein
VVTKPKEVILAIYFDLEQWSPECGERTLGGARDVLWGCEKKIKYVGLAPM